MSDRLPIGPYKMVETGDGQTAPWYLMPFDKDGVCEAPATRDALVEDVERGGYTDVFLFSHGWNNAWADANRLYDGWLAGYGELRRRHQLNRDREVRPLFLGIIWPSAAFLFPGEGGPGFAAVSAEEVDGGVAQEREEVRVLAAGLGPGQRQRLYALAQRESLDNDEVLELAELLAPMYATAYDEVHGPTGAPTADELVQVWVNAAPAADQSGDGDFGFADAAPGSGPTAAGLFDWDPRMLLRLATVWQMKDRAGAVGSAGVGPLLDDLLAADRNPRLHLLGHSYGGKVVLSALCAAPKARKINSVLLLQPAISYLCFSPDAAGAGRPGGFVAAPDRTEQPILTTFSSADFPLTRVFHLAVRRQSDLGERRIAAAPPSKYAALGGFGPAPGAGVIVLDALRAHPQRYDVAPGSARVIGVNGSPDDQGKGITGHGDVSNNFTYWMLYSQVAHT